MKKAVAIIITIAIISSLSVPLIAEESGGFSDVPIGHYAQQDINQLRTLKVTEGIGNNEFGFGDTLTRAQFTVFLGRLMKWGNVSPNKPSFTDNSDVNAWYYQDIETALEKAVVEIGDGIFHPNDLITREEMSLMIINSLGYGWLADKRKNLESPFDDVNENIGYIAMLKDYGIVSGKSEKIFDPKGYAKREEAAAILMRMYRRIKAEVEESNAFYAVKSYHQSDLIQNFDTISFAWTELKVGSVSGGEIDSIRIEENYPDSYELPIDMARAEGKKVQLNVFADEGNSVSGIANVLNRMFDDAVLQQDVIESIIESLSSKIEFDGVVIDFESLRGEESREGFVLFLEQLAIELKTVDKTLTVMVHPDENYDGYNYGEIVDITDRMILMAHDYDAKSLTDTERANGITSTPVAPIESVYEALRSVKAEVSKENLDKVSLQVSFSAAQWTVTDNGTVINDVPYNPLYSKIYDRLIMGDTLINYGVNSRNPYAIFVDSNGISNVLWYEDARSIEEKISLAKMFGINNISVWRLGNIPTYSNVNDKDVYMDVVHLFE